MPQHTQSNWTELDVHQLRTNIRTIASLLRPEAMLIPVVKCNAYGHGMDTVARCAWEEGVRFFSVARIHEALALREQLPNARILMVAPLSPHDAIAAADAAVQTVIVDAAHARSLSKAIQPGTPLECHAKIDSGMGRLGFPWKSAASEIRDSAALPGIALTGLCSHLATSDEADKTFAQTQTARFRQVADECAVQGLGDLFLHLSNSGGIATSSGWDFDGVRAGIALYGYPADEGKAAGTEERIMPTLPCLQWKTRVLQVKRVPKGFSVSYGSTYRSTQCTQIATIDVGYADGYSRLLSNRADVLIGGRRCRVAGCVTMGLTTVDVGPDTPVHPGDEVVLIGRQDNLSIWADELASLCGTISYEVLTAIRSEPTRTLDST